MLDIYRKTERERGRETGSQLEFTSLVNCTDSPLCDKLLTVGWESPKVAVWQFSTTEAQSYVILCTTTIQLEFSKNWRHTGYSLCNRNVRSNVQNTVAVSTGTFNTNCMFYWKDVKAFTLHTISHKSRCHILACRSARGPGALSCRDICFL